MAFFACLAMLSTSFSCSRSVRKDFIMYTYNPKERATVSVPIDGIYFVEGFSRRQSFLPFAFFLNNDGSLTALTSSEVSEVPESKFWQSPDEYLKSMSSSYGREAGHYRVDGANIIIEMFAYYNGIIGHKSIRYKGRINNDSTIVLEKCFCRWCPEKMEWFPEDGNVTFSDQRYPFYQSASLPDTHNLWFRNARWYKKNVWYNSYRDKKK